MFTILHILIKFIHRHTHIITTYVYIDDDVYILFFNVKTTSVKERARTLIFIKS